MGRGKYPSNGKLCSYGRAFFSRVLQRTMRCQPAPQERFRPARDRAVVPIPAFEMQMAGIRAGQAHAVGVADPPASDHRVSDFRMEL